MTVGVSQAPTHVDKSDASGMTVQLSKDREVEEAV